MSRRRGRLSKSRKQVHLPIGALKLPKLAAFVALDASSLVGLMRQRVIVLHKPGIGRD